MQFLKNLFKRKETVLSSSTFKFEPLNKKGANEQIRKKIIQYLKNNFDNTNSKNLINDCTYGVDKGELLFGKIAITLRGKNYNFTEVFMLDNNEIIKITNNN